LLNDGRIRGSGSISLTNGSGSGSGHVDPVDPDRIDPDESGSTTPPAGNSLFLTLQKKFLPSSYIRIHTTQRQLALSGNSPFITPFNTPDHPIRPVLRIRIQIHRIHMFLGHLDPDPDPLVRGMDPDPDPSIIM
jgi:hypothetical protein